MLAVSESTSDDADHNRKLLEQYRTDPDHYARLVRDLRAFQALPPDRQERMRQIDRYVHEEDPALWEVLERYTDWVNGLPEDQQKQIEQANSRDERLATAKELRRKEWIDRQPTKERDELLALSPAEQADRVTELRKAERQRRQEWVEWAAALKARPDAPPNPRPGRPGALPKVPYKLLNDFYHNELTRDERAGLHLDGKDRAEKYEILRQEYFKRHPEALQRNRQN